MTTRRRAETSQLQVKSISDKTINKRIQIMVIYLSIDSTHPVTVVIFLYYIYVCIYVRHALSVSQSASLITAHSSQQCNSASRRLQRRTKHVLDVCCIGNTRQRRRPNPTPTTCSAIAINRSTATAR